LNFAVMVQGIVEDVQVVGPHYDRYYSCYGERHDTAAAEKWLA